MTLVRMFRLTAGVFLLSLVFCSKCPDQQRCGDEQMCCQIRSGEFNCCPFNRGECCDDHLHCCPEGMLCKESRCTNATHSLSWAERVPSEYNGFVKELRSSVTDVLCEDKKSCPDGNTCCKNKDGGWSCCPLPQAVCCEDFVHCCPHGTTCDLAVGTCDNSSSSVPWWKKEPSLIAHNERVPEGSVPWLKKEPSEPTVRPAQNTSVNSAVVTCDPHTCPDHTTCCFMKKSQKWGCCPLDQATCCADGENCCPKGYTCRDTFCEKVSWEKSDSMVFASVGDIDCGGGFHCKDTETCCKISESSFGCCPIPKAVCCSDMQHCCPEGYTCDGAGSCTKALDLIWGMFFKKKQAHAV